METQKQKVLKRLNQYKGRWISFRAFWWDGISEPGTRKSELVSEGHSIVNDWFWENGKKCSYYSINPKRKSAKVAKEKKETIEMFVY